MAEFLATYIAPILLVVGAIFCFTGALGVLRFPDLFSRMHASSITDTLGAACILLGLIFLSDSFIGIAKLVLIFLFLLLTGPTAIHALAKAANHGRPSPESADQEVSSSKP